MITRKAVEARLAALRADEQRLQVAIAQQNATLQATHGAIQDCEFWLQQIGPETVSDAEAVA
jgi:hypothetical protein